jgi:outer membrane protein assembly factor BamB
MRSISHISRRRVAILMVQAIAISLLGGTALADGACAGPAAGGEWPVFGKEVSASRFQDAEHVIGPDNVGRLQPVWVLPADGTFESSPVIAGGCVYIGTQSGHVFALNADHGQLVWDARLPSATTLSVGGGRVFVQSGSTVTALDQASGTVAWQRDFTPYTNSGSPLAFEDMVIAGFSGCIDVGARPAPCRGYYVILDQVSGATVVDGYDTPDADFANGMEGAGFWSQPTYDPEDRYVYFGTANQRSIAPENPTSNALLKIDADPGRDTFGQIVDYFREASNPNVNYPGFEQLCGPSSPLRVALEAVICTNDDDWPSSAVIYRDSNGRKFIGSTHSHTDMPVRHYWDWVFPTGNYFAIDPDGMTEVWRAPTTGARAAVAAYDGTRIYYSSGHEGGIVAVDKDTGAIEWQATTFGANTWQHVSAANGVVYSPSGQPGLLAETGPGLLMAFDARDGTPLLQRSMAQDIGDISRGTTAGGITIARNTVYVPTNGAAAGYLVAYRLP